jgi:hypothetical protein
LSDWKGSISVLTDDLLPAYSYIAAVRDVPTPEDVLSAGAIGSIVMVSRTSGLFGGI